MERTEENEGNSPMTFLKAMIFHWRKSPGAEASKEDRALRTEQSGRSRQRMGAKRAADLETHPSSALVMMNTFEAQQMADCKSEADALSHAASCSWMSVGSGSGESRRTPDLESHELGSRVSSQSNTSSAPRWIAQTEEWDRRSTAAASDTSCAGDPGAEQMSPHASSSSAPPIVALCWKNPLCAAIAPKSKTALWWECGVDRPNFHCTRTNCICLSGLWRVSRLHNHVVHRSGTKSHYSSGSLPYPQM